MIVYRAAFHAFYASWPIENCNALLLHDSAPDGSHDWKIDQPSHFRIVDRVLFFRAVKLAAWPRSAIDFFVLARLEQAGLTPSPEADRRTLIRRLSLDLTGSPPTPQAVHAFVDDRSERAYEQLVDQLLASRRYEERMAQHWLDLARYGDSDGYHDDTPRAMWPYRDYVIESFDKNKPFAVCDAPNREACTVSRPITNTPLQALVLLNDTTFVEATRVFAEQIMEEGGETFDRRLSYAFERATARLPVVREREILQGIYRDLLVHFQADLPAAEEFTATGEWPPAKNVDLAEHAAWTSVAQAILNLDETVTKE